LQDTYQRRRYTSTYPLTTIYRWAKHQHDQRIALVGMSLQYPLYGDDASNYVQYMGRRGPHGAFSSYTTCRAWRRALRAGRFDYVLLVPDAFGLIGQAPPRRELAWTRTDPHSRVVLEEGPRGGQAVLIRLTGPPDPNDCAGLATAATRSASAPGTVDGEFA
jgi:hypothetical protein